MGSTTRASVFLAAYNQVLNVAPLPRWLYVPLNVTVSAGLLAGARRAGVTTAGMGLSAATVPSGLRWGGAAAAAAGIALLAATRSPRLAGHLRDERVAAMTPREVAYHTLVRIPLGTVALEEVAFRGVLLGAYSRHLPTPAAVAASSAVFGLWHVAPTVAALRVNRPELPPRRRAAAVAAAVGVTAFGGVIFSALRLRSGSLLAPALFHTATNSLGTLASWSQARRGGVVGGRRTVPSSG